MNLTRQQVEKVAHLARLAVTDEEKERYGRQLSAILTYIEKLNELDTSQVEPTSHVLPMQNVMRDDEPRPGLPREKALANAPEPHEGFFRVPKIIEEREKK
jgi:aspartyl-tRNA(Asn)/glutamyl-tRNA(Gln) amidotransferase subunit C